MKQPLFSSERTRARRHVPVQDVMSRLSGLMSSVVVVWVLDEVDGVGTRVCVLINLEVVGRESERSQDQVPQVLQFTCSKGQRSEVTGRRSEVT